MLVLGDPTQRSKQNLGPADQTPGRPGRPGRPVLRSPRKAHLAPRAPRSEAGPVEARQRPRGHQLRGGPGPAGAHPEGAGEALLPKVGGLGRGARLQAEELLGLLPALFNSLLDRVTLQHGGNT